jgi:hypothetical protein
MRPIQVVVYFILLITLVNGHAYLQDPNTRVNTVKNSYSFEKARTIYAQASGGYLGMLYLRGN